VKKTPATQIDTAISFREIKKSIGVVRTAIKCILGLTSDY